MAAGGRIGNREIFGSYSNCWPSDDTVNEMKCRPSAAFFAPANSPMLAGTTAVTSG